MRRERVAYSYGCVMAQIPEPLASKMRYLSAAIPDGMLYDDGSGEHGVEDNPHVTVKYGLHTADPEEVAEAIRGFGPVRAELRGMSAFENDNIVVKWDIVSRDLHRLNELICKNLKCTDTYPVYVPHATMAYLNKDAGEEGYHEQFYTNVLDGEVFEINKVRFTHPDGEECWISLVDDVIVQEDGMNKIARELMKIAWEMEDGEDPSSIISYFDLEAAAHKYGNKGYLPGRTQVWYMKPSFFRDGLWGYNSLEKDGNLPDPKRLGKTHELLGSISEKNLDKVFKMMQGHIWSPKGEARHLIKSKGLQHTSMSVGDVIKVGNKAFIVDMSGFKEL